MHSLSFAISILTQIADREVCVTGNELQFEVIWIENDVIPALNCATVRVLWIWQGGTDTAITGANYMCSCYPA